MKKIIFTGLFLLSSLAIVSAQVKLSFNPPKGAKYEYQTEMIQISKVSAMGQDISTEMEMDMKCLMEVVEKTQQEIRVQYTYKDISYIVSSPMMKMGYDSKKPSENPSDAEKMIGKMFNALIGKVFSLTIAPNGSIKSVTGMDAMVEDMLQSIAADGPAIAMISELMKQMFSESNTKKMFEQSFNFYPGNAVKVGDNWTVDNELAISNMNTAAKTKYTVKEIKKNMADIAIESDLEINMALNLSADVNAKMDGLLTGAQTGSMLVDTKTGMPISCDVSQNIKGPVKVQGPDNAQKIEMVMDMTSKTKTSIKDVK